MDLWLSASRNRFRLPWLLSHTSILNWRWMFWLYLHWKYTAEIRDSMSTPSESLPNAQIFDVVHLQNRTCKISKLSQLDVETCKWITFTGGSFLSMRKIIISLQCTVYFKYYTTAHRKWHEEMMFQAWNLNLMPYGWAKEITLNYLLAVRQNEKLSTHSIVATTDCDGPWRYLCPKTLKTRKHSHPNKYKMLFIWMFARPANKKCLFVEVVPQRRVRRE